MSPEQHDTLNRIETKLDQHVQKHEKIDARLDSLENSRAYATGAVAILTLFVGWFKGWFVPGGSH